MALEIQIEKKLPEFTLDVSFTAGNAPLSILGPSGAGKTMLLRCIAGLERAHRGRVALDGRVLLDTASRVHLPARNRRVGMLFQHFALFPHLTVGENVGFGLRNLPTGEQSRRVTALLERTHISGLEKRYPRELSGGEQQRTALARALARAAPTWSASAAATTRRSTRTCEARWRRSFRKRLMLITGQRSW